MAVTDFAPRKQDASVNAAAKTLPSAASTTVNSASIEILSDADHPFIADNTEVFLTTPTLNTTQLPNTETTTFVVADSADDSSFTTILTLDSSTLTGAGGSGATGATKTYKLPSDVRRYVRVSATTSSGTGDQSAASYTFGMKIAP